MLTRQTALARTSREPNGPKLRPSILKMTPRGERGHRCDSPRLRLVFGAVYSSGDPPVSVSVTGQARRVTARNRCSLIKSFRRPRLKKHIRRSVPVRIHGESSGSKNKAAALHLLAASPATLISHRTLSHQHQRCPILRLRLLLLQPHTHR